MHGQDPGLLGIAVAHHLPQCTLELFQPPRVPALTEVHLRVNLTLCGAYVEEFPWSQLQVLTLEGVPSSYIGILFPRIPNIRELGLQMLDTLFEQDPATDPESGDLGAAPPPPCTTFPALSKFTVNCMAILPYMNVPALVSFDGRIETMDSDNPNSMPPLSLLLEFIQRSGCSLVDLTLRDVSSPIANPPQQLCTILQASPELKELELTDIHTENIAAAAAALSPRNNPGACPHLKHLVVTGDSGTVHEVVKMVEKRTNVDLGLVIQGVCSRLDSVHVEETRGENGSIFVQRFSGPSGLWTALGA